MTVSSPDTRWWWLALAAVGFGTASILLFWSANPLLPGAGFLLATCAGLLHQRAARRAAEQRLRDREALIRIVVDGALDAIMTVDTDGAVASFNLAAERMFGWPSEEIIGQNVNLLFTLESEGEEPEGGTGGHPASNCDPVRAGGREVLARQQDGSPFPIYLTCNESDLHGQGVVTAIARDLTQYRIRGQLDLAVISSG